MHVIDFSRSYLRFRLDRESLPPNTVSHAMPTSINNVRIAVDCRCELIDRSSGHSTVFVLGAPCKTERVGVGRDCWTMPNADFCLVMSSEEFLIIKSWAHKGIQIMRYPESLGVQPERQSGLCRDVWPEFSVQLSPVSGRPLESIKEIVVASCGDRTIVARTEYDDGDYHVRIDYPVKSMNYSEREGMYQTDTGPILLPDLSAKRLSQCTRLIECCDLAFVAFNTAGWSEFIVNAPTPVADGVSVNHYSEPRRIEPIRNSLAEVWEETRPSLHQRIDDCLVRTDYAAS